jgi:hypothetical protein
MFSPSFLVPGASTDAAARRIVTFEKETELYKRYAPGQRRFLATDVEPIIPVVQELTQELARADIIAVSTDKDVLINQALDAAKEVGLNQLNEFHQARIAGRLSAGHTEDPHAVEFIEKHGLNQGVSQFTSEVVDALKGIKKQCIEMELKDDQQMTMGKIYSLNIGVLQKRGLLTEDPYRYLMDYNKMREEPGFSDSLEISWSTASEPQKKEIDEANKKCSALEAKIHEQYLQLESQKNTIDQAKEAIIATALLRKHALLKQVLPEFLRKAEASRAVLSRSERRLQEQNYREAGLTDDDLIEQMKEYDQDSRDALKNQQFTDTSYATIKQLSEKISDSLGMSTQQLSDALKEHGQKLSEAVNDAARVQNDATMDAARLQSDATRDAATLQGNAVRDAAILQSGVAMQAARLATHMGSLQITQSENARLLLSDIYDKLSESKPKTSGTSNAINDTYHVVRSLEGGKDLLQTGMSVGANVGNAVANIAASGCHIL